MPGIISVEEAQRQLMNGLDTVEPTTINLEQSLGRVISEMITSPMDVPFFDNSQMDGFAVRSEDVQGVSAEHPKSLKVVADIPAGTNPKITLSTNEAARIMTGAPLPQGCDLVIPIEETDQQNVTGKSLPSDYVQIHRAGKPGDFVRPHGQDMHQGQPIFKPGQQLRAQDLGLLAMLGISQVPVYRKPKIALLSSGDELVPVGQPLTAGKIHDANSYMIRALLENLPVDIIPLGIARDSIASVRSCLDRATSEKADLIISSAGVSVGAFDYMRAVLEADGKIDFWRVNIRPGKPVAFGQYHSIPFIGLPGNPVSAFVGFQVFVRTGLNKLCGRRSEAGTRIMAKLGHPIESDGRESYLRCHLDKRNDQLVAELTESHQGSGNLYSLVQANALLIVPSGVKSLPAESMIEVWLLDN